jgi:hypothetical protein
MQKKIQSEWFDLTMIESCSLMLDPNYDPVFVADMTQIKHLMLESITDFERYISIRYHLQLLNGISLG